MLATPSTSARTTVAGGVGKGRRDVVGKKIGVAVKMDLLFWLFDVLTIA
jgi:hypothetical protein